MASKPNTPTQGIGFVAKNRNRNDDYINARTWQVEGAETAADKAKAKVEVGKLDKTVNWASRSPRTDGGIAGKSGANVTKVYKTY